MNSQEKATLLFHTLLERERVEVKAKEFNKTIAQLQAELYDLMDDEGINSIKIENIEFTPHIEQDFQLSEKYAKLQWDYVPVWFDWLKEISEDGLIKTKETVHHATRKKFLKEWVEESKALPDFIREIFFNTVKYNKSAIKRMVEGERYRKRN